jgi:hypothetical protein
MSSMPIIVSLIKAGEESREFEERQVEILPSRVRFSATDSGQGSCGSQWLCRRQFVPAPMPCPPLPVELVDAIIDRVRDDANYMERRRILGVCSLVSKSWLPRSRSHLFRQVQLLTYRRQRIGQFLNLLSSPISTITPYVKVLDLKQNDHGPEPGWWAPTVRRLTGLYALQGLVISAIRANFPTTFFISRFHNLQTLQLVGCNLDSYAHLSAILSLGPSLRHLTLDDLTVYSYPKTGVTLPSSLRTISLYRRASGHTLEWLVSGDQVPAIDTLILQPIFLKEHQALANCLWAFGPTLRNLRFDLKGDLGQGDGLLFIVFI